MNRDRAYDQIDDYIDGLLDADGRVAFEGFMAEDDELRAEVDAVTDLKRQARALPTSVMPKRDLWPEIRARIEKPAATISFGSHRGQQPRYSVIRYVMAAAALVLMMLGTRAMFELEGTTDPVTPIVAIDPELNRIEEEYAAAKEELLSALRARQASMDEEALKTLAIVEENLAIIEGAVNAITVALAEDPDSPELERMLHAAYQSEVNLLHQAVQLADES